MVVYSLRLRRKKGLLLTEVLMEEVFVRLPVKSLFSCKSVCKHWYSLISRPDFIHLFMNHPSHNNNKLVIVRDHHQLFKFNFEFDSLSKLEQYQFPFKGDEPIKVAGCSNGLLCLYKNMHQVVFFNPSTQTYKMISVHYPPMIRERIGDDYERVLKLPNFNPMDYSFTLGFGFGYDPFSDDFKFVRFVNYTVRLSDTMVYSLKTNLWTPAIDQQHYPKIDIIHDSDCVSINGALHWLLAHHPFYHSGPAVILRFCLHARRYSRINLPAQEGASLMTDLGGQLCISLRHEHGIHVLIFSEQHEDYIRIRHGQWTKLFSFNWPDHLWVRPIAYSSSNQDKVLVQLDETSLVWYDLKTKAVCPLSVQGMKQNTTRRDPHTRDTFAYLMYVCVRNPLPLTPQVNGRTYQRKKRRVLQSRCH